MAVYKRISGVAEIVGGGGDVTTADLNDAIDGAEGTAAALDQAHEDATAPHGYHPRYFVGNGSGTYAATQDMRIYVSHTTDEDDPVLTGLPAGIVVVTVPGT